MPRWRDSQPRARLLLARALIDRELERSVPPPGSPPDQS
jgi:hypothetical protein